jgi:acetyl esterase/lipase
VDARDETARGASGIRHMKRGRSWTLAVVGVVAMVVGPGPEAASAGNPAAVGPAGNPAAVDAAEPAAIGGVADGVRVLRDIPYAPADPPGSRGHLLDLYLPRPTGHALRPLAIWTGGSAWLADTGKESAAAIAPPILARGYAVAGVSIRSSTQAIFPAQVHDIKAAIRWLRANARQYGIDASRIAIMGDSSGGWTTAMAALTGDVRALEGTVGTTGVSSRVRAAVAFYPPTDFLQMDEQMLPGACADFNALLGITDCHNDPRSPESRLVGCAIQSCPRTVARANPISYVSRRDPPMMILHGQADRLVPHGQSILLYNALRARCMDATFFSVPGAGHDWRQVTDPANHTAHTVYRTRACRERVTVGAPDPTWDTIVDFLDRALDVRER